MRNLITDYSFEPNTRTITLDKFANLSENNPFSVENIRLIVNETQKVVVCSSMQKDNIIAVEGNTITYTEALTPLAFGDQLTIEVDMGDGILYAAENFAIQMRVNKGKGLTPDDSWAIEGALADMFQDYGRNVYLSLFAGAPITRVSLPNLKSISNGSFSQTFDECSYIDSVDLRSVKIIQTLGANYMFRSCVTLKSINLSSLEQIYSDYAARGMFTNCTNLKEVVLPNLTYIGAGTASAESMFSGCTKLVRFSAPKLSRIAGYQGTCNMMFQNCTSLKTVDLRSLQEFIATGAATIANNMLPSSVNIIFIGSNALSASVANNSVIGAATGITDLYLYGDATNSIYLSWQGSLNFNSVCGVLKKLCENTDANGLVCAFKSGFKIDDKTEWTWTDGDGNSEDISNPNGILKALREQATSQGWTIQNLQING